MPTVQQVADAIVAATRRRVGSRTSSVVEELLATSTEPDGTLTLVWSVRGRAAPYGMSWNVRTLRKAFVPHTLDVLEDVVWNELDEPHGPGSPDPDRARGLVARPEDVRWLDRG